MEKRMEKDSLGEVAVPADKYWGAQTERSRNNFKTGSEKMPEEVIYAIALVKRAAAQANTLFCKLSEERRDVIFTVCDEILRGELDDNFPLSVWQTGSGTQTNMNVNEVIANRGNAICGKKLLHPNDHVNMSQSSNDVFPTAMHIAAVAAIEDKLLPAIDKFISALKTLEEESVGIVKVGRTHLQDATPIAFSQEISGWRGMAEAGRGQICLSLNGLKKLAIGGTAVGTGLNAPKGFGAAVAKELSSLTGKDFSSEENKFYALSAKDRLSFAHGALKAFAANLMKIANDVRWLAAGPRAGLSEITIPANEPGSSIMPGKVNPTQCEAAAMVAVQVMANDVAVGFAASQGNFELNVYMPVIIYNFLQSVNLLAGAVESFTEKCVCGIRPNAEKMKFYLDRSLMTVTALTPYIGYDNAALAAKKALAENVSLKEACLALKLITAEKFDEIFRPEEMI